MNMDGNGVVPVDASVNLFGLCIPGRDVLTSFVQVDENMVTLMIEAPKYVAELSFFLLPGCALPDDQGALLYYSVGPEFTEWQVLGAIANGKSSGKPPSLSFYCHNSDDGHTNTPPLCTPNQPSTHPSTLSPYLTVSTPLFPYLSL